MKFKIVNVNTEDYFILEKESLEKIRKEAIVETKKRNWNNCYSEKLI